MRSSQYIGEGMSASLTGLALGLVMVGLRATSAVSQGLIESLLTFNHTNFFVYDPEHPVAISATWSNSKILLCQAVNMLN